MRQAHSPRQQQTLKGRFQDSNTASVFASIGYQLFIQKHNSALTKEVITTFSPRRPAVQLPTCADTDAAQIQKQLTFAKSGRFTQKRARVNRPAEHEVGQGHLGVAEKQE